MVELKSKNYSYILIASVLTFVIILLLSLFAIRPLWDGNQKLYKEVKDKKDELSSLEDKEEKLKELKDREIELNIDKKKVLTALPEEKEQERIFTQIERVAEAAGFIPDSPDQKGEKDNTIEKGEEIVSAPEGVTEIPMSVNLKGDYNSFKTFLEKLEVALRVIDIDSMDVKVDSGNNNLNISLQVTTFFKTLGGQE